jgi:hypothetical protein
MKTLLHRASGCDRARAQRLCAFRGSRARVALMSGTALVGAALCVSLAVVPAFAVASARKPNSIRQSRMAPRQSTSWPVIWR